MELASAQRDLLERITSFKNQIQARKEQISSVHLQAKQVFEASATAPMYENNGDQLTNAETQEVLEIMEYMQSAENQLSVALTNIQSFTTQATNVESKVQVTELSEKLQTYDAKQPQYPLFTI